MDHDEIWEQITIEYKFHRERLLKELRDLDDWYGEQNILLSSQS